MSIFTFQLFKQNLIYKHKKAHSFQNGLYITVIFNYFLRIYTLTGTPLKSKCSRNLFSKNRL